MFNQYPYINENDLNLDYILATIKRLKEIMDEFITLNSVTFADPIIWNITTQYARNTIVLDPTGNAYLSKEVVPAGVQLNNSDYWLEIFNFTEYTRTANQNLTVNVETNTTRATVAYNVDDWLIWNDVLYKVTNAIAIDDTFIVAPSAGSNIIHFTVEDFCKAWIASMQAAYNAFTTQVNQTVNYYYNQTQAQINQIIAGATVDSEVINARVSWDGVTYTTLRECLVAVTRRVYEQCGTRVFWNHGGITGSTGFMRTHSRRITTEKLPISKMKYVYPINHDNVTVSIFIARYTSTGYVGYMTGGNEEDGYTWGTSGGMAINAVFTFDRLKQDYPNDYIRIFVIEKIGSTEQELTLDNAKDVLIFADIDRSDSIRTSLNIKNGRITGTTGMITPAGNQLNRMITSDFIPIADISRFNIAFESTYKCFVFLYDANKSYLGGLNNNNVTDYTEGTTGAAESDWNFDYLAAAYPKHFVRFVFLNDAETDFTLDDIAPYIDIEYRTDNLILQPKVGRDIMFNNIDKEYLKIAYSFVSAIGDAPSNSIEHFEYCALYNDSMFNALKGDARITSDNKVIMCHDAGFTFDNDGRIVTFNSQNYTPIRNLTYDECMALEFANLYHGSHPHVCDLHTFLATCKEYGKIAYLVVRDEYIEDALEEFYKNIYDLSMMRHLIVNSFTYESLELFAAYDPDTIVSLVINNGALGRGDISKMTKFNNPMLCLYDFGGSHTGFTAIQSYYTRGLIQTAIDYGIRLHAAICNINDLGYTTSAFIKECLRYNLIGAQINRPGTELYT